VGTYWEHVGGTHWKLGEHVDGNTMGTKLGTRKTQHPCPPPKENAFGPLGVDAASPHWLQDFFLAYLCSLPFWP